MQILLNLCCILFPFHSLGDSENKFYNFVVELYIVLCCLFRLLLTFSLNTEIYIVWNMEFLGLRPSATAGLSIPGGLASPILQGNILGLKRLPNYPPLLGVFPLNISLPRSACVGTDLLNRDVEFFFLSQ